MSSNVSRIDGNNSQSIKGKKPDPAEVAQKRAEFEREKAQVLQMAKGNSQLSSQISALKPGKGAMQQLQALEAQASASQTQTRVQSAGANNPAQMQRLNVNA